MADVPGMAAPAARKPYPWTELFRCFQVALDPRKLLVAAGGILAMALGWYILSAIFYSDRPLKDRGEYMATVAAETDWKAKSQAEIAVEAEKRYENDLKPYLTEAAKGADGKSTEDVRKDAVKKYNEDLAQYQLLKSLAGPGGRIRSMPWYEYRGKNPYEFLTGLSSIPSAAWFDATLTYLKGQLPVMLEPLAKLFLPIVKFTDPNASLLTRFYLFFVLTWNVLVWAFAGGVITRIAAVQLSGKDRVTIAQACTFVCNRYMSYALSPIVPVGVVGAVVLGICVLGLVCLIPILGDALIGLVGWPLTMLGGVIMTILFIGLVGYPLMTATLSTEGSDTFDALSRSYNYVFQAPWAYAWNWFVAIVYGAIVTFFVILVASLMVYLGKWALSQTPLTESTNQNRDYLFIHAPESFGWKKLLLQGGDLQGYTAANGQWLPYDANAAAQYESKIRWWNWIGAGLTTFWLVAVFLLMLGFSYSFFWSAATMIYLLMRSQVDEVELDEVYLEDDDIPPPPGPITMTAPPPPAPATLPMVDPPPPAVPPSTMPETKTD